MPGTDTPAESPIAAAAQDAGHDATASVDVAGPSGGAEANDDAQLDAVLASINAGEGRDAAAKAYQAKAAPVAKAGADVPATKSGLAGGAQAAGTTPAPADAQPFVPTDEQRQLLQRFKVKDSTVAKFDPDERAELLANLKERHDAQAAMWQENQQLRRGQPAPQQQATPPAPKPAADDAQALLAQAAETYGEDSPAYRLLKAQQERMAAFAEQVRPLQERAAEAQAENHRFWEAKAAEDQSAGIDAIPRDLGVNLDLRTTEGKANRDAVLAEAGRFMEVEMARAGWTPKTYGWKDAISDAFPKAFKAQTILAQRKTAAADARKAARGSVEPAGLPNRTQKPESEDAVLDRILAAQRQGATRQELELIGAGRG